MKEITVTIKGEESSYKQKFLEYRDFVCSEDDPVINELIQEALDNAKIEPIDIKFRVLMVRK